MGRPTPNTSASGAYVTRRVRFPVEYKQSVSGALTELFTPGTWEQVGDITPEDARAAMYEMFGIYIESDNMYIGAIVFYITSTPPAGVLPFDDSIYNRVDYPELYSVLHPTFIVDADRFQLHSWAGRCLVASGSGAGLTPRSFGDEFGTETEALTAAQNGPHDHTYQVSIYTDVDLEDVGVPQPALGSNAPAQTTQSGSGDPHNNIQPSVSFPVGVVAL